ncbi:MAG: hypothetical protein KDK64_04810 [Chlamydiia bacterium]|nr:hypothetical protein [Chlamydiia bacterium]
MKKRTYRLLNMIYGGVSGLLTGGVMKFFWISFGHKPAMLFMLLIHQMHVFSKIQEKTHVSDDALLVGMHFVTATILGVVFALLSHRLVKSVWNGLGLGFLFGMMWWVLTPFYLLPFFFVVSPNVHWTDLTMYDLLQTLGSHIIFGVVLGFFYALFCILLRRQARDG